MHPPPPNPPSPPASRSWGNIDQINAQNGNPELSLASMWVRIGSQWLIYLLYGWSLIAPRLCPNRDFS